MVEKYRVAIVGGAGSWGRHYTRAYVARPDCDVVLVERFFADSTPDHWITPVVDRLVRVVDSGVLTSTGHDYRQALEIAIALTLSAHNNHQRVDLPLADRTLKLYPSPYRLHGGDVIGWEGNSAAPELA